jgi:hypothetical protein
VAFFQLAGEGTKPAEVAAPPTADPLRAPAALAVAGGWQEF